LGLQKELLDLQKLYKSAVGQRDQAWRDAREARFKEKRRQRELDATRRQHLKVVEAL
jgi:hypothetical protein